MKTILIVLDSFGVGAMPDAAAYGDAGSNTAASVVKLGGARLKNLRRMGLFNIQGVNCRRGVRNPAAAYGRASERSAGKDSTTGHWELMGVCLQKPFPTFPGGFPPELVRRLEEAFGRGILGNCAESGTQIIQRLGDAHVQSGKPIVYTSADSVLQIAAHTDVIPLETLYDLCRKAREILRGDWEVGRVIARPFAGKSGAYERLPQRMDFSVRPPETLLNIMQKSGLDVIGIGKIGDLFAESGLTESCHAKGNEACLAVMAERLRQPFSGLMLVNLVDFDTLYGHRNDAKGYARAMEVFDRALPSVCGALGDEDVLIITADHGCDPGTESTDHSREYIPVLVYGKSVPPVDLGTMNGFDSVGRMVARRYGLRMPEEEETECKKNG